MANLQQITLTVDELTQSGTLLHPTSGYEAIESVTLSGSWDYWPQGYDWEDVDGINHGVLTLDYSYFMDAYPEISGNWTNYPSEILLDYTMFNPVLASKNDYHTSTRCGTFMFSTMETDFLNPDSEVYEHLPMMSWRLIEAASFSSCRQVLTQFNGTPLTATDLSPGVVLKFLGTAYPNQSYYGSRGSYYAYFVNNSTDPCRFYLLGLEATARNRIDPNLGDYVDIDQPNIINTPAAGEWWYSCEGTTLYIKYLDQIITDY